jgi:hypothetical protein
MKLRRTIFGAVAGAALLALASTQGAVAQIYEEWDISLQPRFYIPQTNQGIQIPRSSFRDNFAPNVVDPDDGVAGPFNIGFPFEYSNQVYTQFYVCVNGWISFQNPGAYITSDPYSLFNAQRPNLTIAPFFGDHYLRTPNFDETDPAGRFYTPSTIRYVNYGADTSGRSVLVVEWEKMNINYMFDPTQPDNPFAPVDQVEPQAPSVGSFQVWLYSAPTGATTPQGSIEFHYGPVGPEFPIPIPDSVGSIVKTSGASVGIEDEPQVPNGNTTFINAVAYREARGSWPEDAAKDTARTSTRLTRIWPPTGFPGLAFVFSGKGVRRIRDWGDGDADLTQVDMGLPAYIRDDQRRYVTFLDVIRILRNSATRTNGRSPLLDSTVGRHAFHGDVNHDGRYYFSSRNYDNTADSIGFNSQIVRYRVNYPTKSTDWRFPQPLDNSFNGFFFEADEFDASLIMLYLAAKLPVLPWLHDTLPHFSGKLVVSNVASDIRVSNGALVGEKRVEIPITFNGYLSGALGVGMNATNGTRIIEVKTMPKTDNAWVEAVSSEDRLALAAAGNFSPDDVIATMVVEANDAGDVTFENVKVGSEQKDVRKFNIYGATTGDASSLSLTSNYPNPFVVGNTTVMGYTLPTDGKVVIRVFDVLGREVKTLVNAPMTHGAYQTEWNGLDNSGKPVQPGVYFCRIESAGKSHTVAMQVK